MMIFLLFCICNITLVHSSALPSNKKICKDCKFYIPNNFECRKIPNIDLVTGKESYNSASTERRHRCGYEAKYFEKNNLKFLTVPYYFLVRFHSVFGYILFTFILSATIGYVSQR